MFNGRIEFGSKLFVVRALWALDTGDHEPESMASDYAEELLAQVIRNYAGQLISAEDIKQWLMESYTDEEQDDPEILEEVELQVRGLMRLRVNL